MARSLNKVELIGNLGQDPEIRTTPQGSSVCTLKIATSDSYKDKNSGEWKETTEWHRVVLWDNLAETAGKYLKKGSKIFVEGKLKSRTYEDNSGTTRNVTEVLGLSMILLDGRNSGGSTGYDSKPESSAPASKPAPAVDNFADDDDEVPF